MNSELEEGLKSAGDVFIVCVFFRIQRKQLSRIRNELGINGHCHELYGTIASCYVYHLFVLFQFTEPILHDENDVSCNLHLHQFIFSLMSL